MKNDQELYQLSQKLNTFILDHWGTQEFWKSSANVLYVK